MKKIIDSNQRIHQGHNFRVPCFEITSNFVKEQKQQGPSNIAEVSYFKPAGNQRHYFAGTRAREARAARPRARARAATQGCPASPCETLPGTPLYLIGPGSIKLLLSWVAKLFAKDGTTVVYQDDSSCVGVEKMFVPTEGMENDPGNEAWTTYFDKDGVEHPCKFVAGNVRPHIGLSDVFAQTCKYNVSGIDHSVVDNFGPVQAFGFIVPKDPASTQTSISAEAAAAVYGGSGVTPWNDVRYVFQRSASSGTQNMIATSLGLDPNAFFATTSVSSDDEANLVGCSPAKDKTLGILAVDLVESWARTPSACSRTSTSSRAAATSPTRRRAPTTSATCATATTSSGGRFT